MDYMAAMRAFVRAVDLGSFSKAAIEEDIKVSTVSRYVSALEADLGAALLNRSTRRLHLTEAGSVFYERATGILSSLEAARLETSSLNAIPQGLLRINVAGAFGRRHIIPHLKDFRLAYPLVRLDVTLTENMVNLIETGADFAVRVGVMPDSMLVAKRLASQRWMLVGGPDYLRRRGTPGAPQDLSRHECLILQQAKDVWCFRQATDLTVNVLEVKVDGSLRANDAEAILHTVRDGLGVALLPSWLLGEDITAGRLIPLLSDWTCSLAQEADWAIWGVYPPKKTVSPKVRAFLGFLTERFGRPPYWDRDAP
jgi:DNA-binding transcriptional LysR family regulator